MHRDRAGIPVTRHGWRRRCRQQGSQSLRELQNSVNAGSWDVTRRRQRCAELLTEERRQALEAGGPKVLVPLPAPIHRARVMGVGQISSLDKGALGPTQDPDHPQAPIGRRLT